MVSTHDEDYPIIPDDVRANAEVIVAGYGMHAAIAQARRLQQASSVPRYAAAVLAEVERLCGADAAK